MNSLEWLRKDVDKERRKAEKKFKRQENKVSDGVTRCTVSWVFFFSSSFHKLGGVWEWRV